MGGRGGVGGGGTEGSLMGSAGCCQSLDHQDRDALGRGQGRGKPEEPVKSFLSDLSSSYLPLFTYLVSHSTPFLNHLLS